MPKSSLLRSLSAWALCVTVISLTYLNSSPDVASAKLVGIRDTIYSVSSLSSSSSSISASAVSITGKATTATFRLVATNNSGTLPTLDCKVQQSPTGAANTWSDLFSFAQVTTASNSIENVSVPDINGNFYGSFRSICLLQGTTPNYDINVTVYHD